MNELTQAEIERLSNLVAEVNEPCEVCGNTADELGRIEHGRGCYVVEEDGGGSTFVDLESLGQATRELWPKIKVALAAEAKLAEVIAADKSIRAALNEELERLQAKLAAAARLAERYRDACQDAYDDLATAATPLSVLRKLEAVLAAIQGDGNG